MAGEMVCILDSIVSRCLFGRSKHPNNLLNDACFHNTLRKLLFFGKLREVVAKLKKKIALLVQLEYAAIFEQTIGEVGSMPVAIRSSGLGKHPAQMAANSVFDLFFVRMHELGVY